MCRSGLYRGVQCSPVLFAAFYIEIHFAIPVYQGCDNENTEAFRLALGQLSEAMQQPLHFYNLE